MRIKTLNDAAGESIDALEFKFDVVCMVVVSVVVAFVCIVVGISVVVVVSVTIVRFGVTIISFSTFVRISSKLVFTRRSWVAII